MEIGGGQGLTAPQVWSTPVRTLTADPATDAGAASLVWQHVSRLLTIGGASVPSGSTQRAFNLGTQSLLTAGTFLQLSITSTPGVLLSCGMIVSTALAGGVITASFQISVDSGPAIVIPMYSSAINWDVAGQVLAYSVVGTGSAVGNSISWQMPLQFGSSLTISVLITATTLTTGVITVAASSFTHL